MNGESGTHSGILTDTGPLFALVDPQGQPAQFARCQAALAGLTMPMLTTWPCLTEALYLTLHQGRWPMQKQIWQLVEDGMVQLVSLTSTEAARLRPLMEQYRDRPMDVADASLLALAEGRGFRRIFSLDSDFYIYRLADGSVLEVIPGSGSSA